MTKATSTDRAAVSKDAIDRFLNGLKAQADPAAQREYMTMTATTAISTMHGTLGKEFTREYLEAAMQSLDDPTTIFLTEPTRQ